MQDNWTGFSACLLQASNAMIRIEHAEGKTLDGFSHDQLAKASSQPSHGIAMAEAASMSKAFTEEFQHNKCQGAIRQLQVGACNYWWANRCQHGNARCLSTGRLAEISWKLQTCHDKGAVRLSSSKWKMVFKPACLMSYQNACQCTRPVTFTEWTAMVASAKQVISEALTA